MRRRTLLRAALTLAAWLKVQGAKAWAQEVTFPGARRETLDRIGEAVLPGALGPAGRAAAVEQFFLWVREYRACAAMSPFYGNTPWAMSGAIFVDAGGDGWAPPLPALTIESP